jgi:hypothetical protein
MAKRIWKLEEFTPTSYASADIMWLIVDRKDGTINGVYNNGDDFDYSEDGEECIAVRHIN